MTEDVTLVGGRMLTMDPSWAPERPAATSIALRGGRIAALDPPAPIGRVIDLAGRTVLPGLIDSHLHCVLGGETLRQLDLSGCTGRAQFEALVAARSRELPEGAWLIARGWNEDRFDGGSGGLPTKAWLAGAGERPCVAWRMDIHACVVNDAVLRILASRHDLGVDPAGGRILRDDAGRPTGLLQEAAAWTMVNPVVPSPAADEERAGFLAAQEHLASLGITAVGTMEYSTVLRRAILPERDRLTVRMLVTLLDRDWPLDLGPALSFPRDERCAVIGMKAFVDGTFGSRTARMLEPYADDPANRGLFVELAERGVLGAWAGHVRAHGLSPSMHAIGDEAVRAALEAVESSAADRAPLARIEHAQTVAPEDLGRIGRRRDLVVSMQPLHKRFDAHAAATRLDDRRMARFFPFRSLRDAGATLAFGSDWPVVAADPLEGIAAAVTGLDADGRPCRPEENIGVEDALLGYTRHAARCLGIDAGVLAPGRLADLTVLDRDPRTCDWTRERPRVLMTMMGGRTTFEA